MKIKILDSDIPGFIETELNRLGQVLASSWDAEVLWVGLKYRIDRAVLELMPHLRAIVSPTTGLDHIDLEECQRREITVLSLQGETELLKDVPATAEHTWGLALALARRIPWAFDSVRDGRWERHRFQGRDLKGKTLGIFGMGRVGKQVAAFGHAFGMKVVYYDEVPVECPNYCQRRTSLGVFCAADVLSIHVPLTERTQGIIGARLIRMMKKGSFLVNTSRGAVIDEGALVEALEEGWLAGAALDVICGETETPGKSKLIEYARTHQNLLITPHLGGCTVESMAMTQEFMVRKLEEFLKELVVYG